MMRERRRPQPPASLPQAVPQTVDARACVSTKTGCRPFLAVRCAWLHMDGPRARSHSPLLSPHAEPLRGRAVGSASLIGTLKIARPTLPAFMVSISEPEKARPLFFRSKTHPAPLVMLAAFRSSPVSFNVTVRHSTTRSISKSYGGCAGRLQRKCLCEALLP